MDGAAEKEQSLIRRLKRRLSGRRFRASFKAWGARFLLIAGGVTMLVPLAWMIVTSLKDEAALREQPNSWRVSMPRPKDELTLGLDFVYVTRDDFSETMLEDFEEDGTERVEMLSGEARIDANAKVGRGSLSCVWDLTMREAAGVRIVPPAPIRVEGVEGIVFWADGNRSGHHLELEVETDKGRFVTHQPWTLDFDGWRELSAHFMEDTRLKTMPLLVLRNGRDEPKPLQLGPTEALDLEIRALEFKVGRVGRLAAYVNRLTVNFLGVWKLIPFGKYFRITILVAVFVTFCQVLTSSLAGYAFARLDFPYRDKIFYIYLATLMIPGDVTMIPRFILVRKLGLYDSFWVLVLPGISSAFGTFLMRQFFRTIPKELEEAARIDGCSRFGVWWRIMLPLSKPALASLSVLSFMGAWNMFLWALITTKSEHLRMLQVGINGIASTVGNQYNLMMAGALMALIPTVTIFMAAQKAFRRGLMTSGLKG